MDCGILAGLAGLGGLGTSGRAPSVADLVWGRAAGARDGLFTAIEKALVRVNAT